jgi:hypothetical protein
MQNDTLLWLAAAFYAWQVMEEFVYDWKTCAAKATHLRNSWVAFYVANIALLVLGIDCVYVGWQITDLRWVYLASILINIIFFHMIPTIIQRRFSSRLIHINEENVRLFSLSLRIDELVLWRRVGTWMLFLPAATAIYSAALQDAKLIAPALIISLMSVIVIIAYPIWLLRTFGSRSKEASHENPGN